MRPLSNKKKKTRASEQTTKRGQTFPIRVVRTPKDGVPLEARDRDPLLLCLYAKLLPALLLLNGLLVFTLLDLLPLLVLRLFLLLFGLFLLTLLELPLLRRRQGLE
jgi:hypothetical protein